MDSQGGQHSPHSSSPEAKSPQGGNGGSDRHPAIDRIDEALRGLRYGSVVAIVHDGIVVQIERTEKTRITPGAPR